MKKSDIVQALLSYHPMIEDYQGCDEYKSGFEDEECTGVAVALVPTLGVIRRTIEAGCNLLITHEPIFYQTPDFPKWFASFDNHVASEKERLLRENHITVWRDHDHMHAHRPDSIFAGVLKYLGWTDYLCEDEGFPEMTYVLDLPQTDATDLSHFLMERIGMNGVRLIGNPHAKIRRIALVGHLYPEAFGKTETTPDGFTEYGTEIIGLMEHHGVQAIIPGEVIEWTVLSYIRDAAAMGEDKAALIIGHFNWEELGMRYARDYIEELVFGACPVKYLPTGDIAEYITKEE